MRKGNIILGSVIAGIYAVSSWWSTGHWPQSWVVVLIFVGICLIGAAADGIQALALSVSQIYEQNEEIKEKIDQLGESIDALEGRIPRQRSLLDEY